MRLRDGLQTALGVLYPPRCVSCDEMVESDFGLCGACWGKTPFIGLTACDQCGVPLPGQIVPGERLICDTCLRNLPPWNQGRAALLYQDKARTLVLRLKHGDRQDIVRPASHWMAKAAQSMALDPNSLIAPIPLHWMRMLRRRYNQSALLAQSLARLMQMGYGPDLLSRPKPTPSLDGRSRVERETILENAIAVNPKRRSQILGRSVLIVDDVMTTGATLTSAAQACLDAGAKQVNVLVLARVEKDA